MDLPITLFGLLAAAAAVVAGAPLFAAGLAAVRSRRDAGALAPEPLSEHRLGPALVVGEVRLESPLFAPLSQRACAGFVLEVAALGSGASARIEDRRAFTLVHGAAEAHVAAAEAEWMPAVTDSREIAAGETVPSRLEGLIESVPEARWLRGRGAIRVTERALLPSAPVWVAGQVRRSLPAESAVERVLAATGTDDATEVLIEAAGQEEPALWIEPAEASPLRVFGAPPDLRALAPPASRMVLALLGPLVSLAGLLYLARALERSLGGRF